MIIGRGGMDGAILQYLQFDHLVFGTATGDDGPALHRAGCNNSVEVLARCSAYTNVPRELLVPFVFIYRGRTCSGGEIYYKDILMTPTLNAQASRIQRAWRRRRFESTYGGVAELA